MANYIVSDTDLTAIANAIREKTGGTDPLVWPADFTDSIDSISGGTAKRTLARKNVNFYDYDGTLVYSYDKDEFLGLDELPANPDHSHDEIPLTAEGWNWSLSDARTFVNNYDYLDIGQNYVTTSGETMLVIEIDSNTAPNKPFYLCLTQADGETINVDWGDNSTITSESSTTTLILQHLYNPGRYIIKIWADNNAEYGLGDSISDSNNAIYGAKNATNEYNRGRIRQYYAGKHNTKIQNFTFAHCYNLEKVSLSNTLTAGIDQTAFYQCIKLDALIIPAQITTLENTVFANCYNISTISLPSTISSIVSGAFNSCYCLQACMFSSITSFPSSLFNGCYNITTIILPEGVSTIQNNSFKSCYCLTKLILPSSVKTINNDTFSGCYSLTELYMKSTNPPSLASSSAFAQAQSDFTIYVPYSSDHSILTAYKTATNWSAVAEKIVEEPENTSGGGDDK